MKVFADKYSEMQKAMGGSEGLTPVDLNGAHVPVDKHDKSNLKNTQESIQWRTQLDGGLHAAPPTRDQTGLAKGGVI